MTAARNAIAVALNAIQETHPSQKNDVNRLLTRVNDSSVNDDAIHNDMKKLKFEISQEKQRENFAIQYLLDDVDRQVQSLIGQGRASSKQKALLEEMKLTDSHLPTDAILALSVAVNVFAEEAITLRHERTPDASSEDTPKFRQLIKSFVPILKNIINEYPDDTDLQLLFDKAVSISEGGAVSIFDIIGVMEKTTKRISTIQTRRQHSEAQYLLAFHQHLKAMHEALNESINSNEIFSSESDEAKVALETIMAKFKSDSVNESDPAALRLMINENVSVMQSSFKTIMEKQRNHIRNQQNTMKQLKQDVELKAAECENLQATNKSLKNAYVNLEKRTMTDQLTGIPNRRAYDIEIDAINKTVSKLTDPYDIAKYSLIVMDVDKFKNINDNFGHNVGDKVLQTVSATAHELTKRVSDPNMFQVYRYGGEEFVIICQGASLSMSCAFAELLRDVLDKKVYTAKKQKLKVTASFGVASFNHLTKHAKAVFKQADDSMYRSKSLGRNQVCYFQNSIISKYEKKNSSQ